MVILATHVITVMSVSFLLTVKPHNQAQLGRPLLFPTGILCTELHYVFVCVLHEYELGTNSEVEYIKVISTHSVTQVRFVPALIHEVNHIRIQRQFGKVVMNSEVLI